MTGRGHLAAGIRLALTTFTVLPIRPSAGSVSSGDSVSSTDGVSGTSSASITDNASITDSASRTDNGTHTDSAAIDRAVAGIAMSVAPAVGALLGLVPAGLLLGASLLGAAPIVAAVLAVATGALLTRGLHLDGLADTVDGLGSYRDADGALAIMRRPDIGPFGVIALILVLLGQIASIAAILSRALPTGVWPTGDWPTGDWPTGDWPGAGGLSVLAAIVATTAAGRLAITAACRRGVPAARPNGLGAAVAGTVGSPAMIIGAVAVAALAVAAVPGRPWQGPVAVGAGLFAAWLLRRHVVRRLGGITGDVLGALCETTITITYLAMSM